MCHLSLRFLVLSDLWNLKQCPIDHQKNWEARNICKKISYVYKTHVNTIVRSMTRIFFASFPFTFFTIFLSTQILLWSNSFKAWDYTFFFAPVKVILTNCQNALELHLNLASLLSINCELTICSMIQWYYLFTFFTDLLINYFQCSWNSWGTFCLHSNCNKILWWASHW